VWVVPFSTRRREKESTGLFQEGGGGWYHRLTEGKEGVYSEGGGKGSTAHKVYSRTEFLFCKKEEPFPFKRLCRFVFFGPNREILRRNQAAPLFATQRGKGSLVPLRQSSWETWPLDAYKGKDGVTHAGEWALAQSIREKALHEENQEERP